MEKNKMIGLAVTLVVIIGAIWYLESIQVHPGTGSGAPAQAISVDATSTGADTADSMAENSSSVAGTQSGGAGNAAVAAMPQSVQDIAATDKKAGYKPAIEIADPTGFINASSNFKLASLIGKKVILVDFWTYSCINCIRTLPYVTAWYDKYKDQGLVVVGVHTPEFDFEKNITNVKAAVAQYGIHYPVIMDSNYGTWSAYGNLYWPHEYLIDIAGYIVHDHVGEGSYDETEGIIQQLLTERETALGSSTAMVATSTVGVPPPDLSGIHSPETYFGANRNSYLANGYPMTNGTQVLADPSSVNENSLYLTGSWDFEDEYAKNNQAGAKVTYKYDSAKVFLVASAAMPAGVTVEVLQDGKPVTANAAGSDVKDGKVTITTSRLYNLINNSDGPGVHTLQLIIDVPGLEAFTFTFG